MRAEAEKLAQAVRDSLALCGGIFDLDAAPERLAELDQDQRIVEFALETHEAGDSPLQTLALAHDLLGGLRIMPQLRVFGAPVELGEPLRGSV